MRINGGTFILNGGIISGNSGNYNYGGGVYNAGTFIMKEGEISGNFGYTGGGVYNYGTFSASGGVIYGSGASAALKNTASSYDGGAALYNRNGSVAQYGAFGGDIFYPSGNLSTTGTTIRIVNGSLQTN